MANILQLMPQVLLLVRPIQHRLLVLNAQERMQQSFALPIRLIPKVIAHVWEIPVISPGICPLFVRLGVRVETLVVHLVFLVCRVVYLVLLGVPAPDVLV